MANTDAFNINLDTKRLMRKLEDLPKKLANKGATKATREAAKIVMRDAVALVPIDEGDLEKSLKVRARKRSRRNKGTVGHSVITGESTSKAFVGEQYYGAFVELGYQKKNGEQHPADPFLRPALWGNQQEVKRKFNEVLRAWLKDQGKGK